MTGGGRARQAPQPEHRAWTAFEGVVVRPPLSPPVSPRRVPHPLWTGAGVA